MATAFLEQFHAEARRLPRDPDLHTGLHELLISTHLGGEQSVIGRTSPTVVSRTEQTEVSNSKNWSSPQPRNDTPESREADNEGSRIRDSLRKSRGR